MGLFVPSKQASHRRFAYRPRFYDPTKDERIKKRIRIQGRARRRRSPAGIIYFLLLLGMALFIYHSLGS